MGSSRIGKRGNMRDLFVLIKISFRDVLGYGELAHTATVKRLKISSGRLNSISEIIM